MMCCVVLCSSFCALLCSAVLCISVVNGKVLQLVALAGAGDALCVVCCVVRCYAQASILYSAVHATWAVTGKVCLACCLCIFCRTVLKQGLLSCAALHVGCGVAYL